ncbi:MAG: ABC transporter substrate-binding protein [Methylomonas sp.]|nr:ABC transporter substrate-binding protein [Methylomonas sp.]
MNKNILWLLAFALFSKFAVALDATHIRLGVLASGTLAWELAAMKNEGLLDDANFKLDTVALANQQAGKVALQAGSVDIIVSDWIWLSSMRAEGGDYSFYPYSANAGSLVVPANSDINTLTDLKGKKLGIAGGELDKNWALLQSLAQSQQMDLNQSVEKVYGAAPLLNQQLLGGRIDALLTYWHFAARLEAQGYKQLMSGEDITRALGVTETVPSLGYVFKQSWAERHKDALQQFLKIARTAKDNLCDSDSAWQKVAGLTETDDPATQKQIRARYCEGRIASWGAAEKNAAARIYQLLRQTGGGKLTGKAETLQAELFWPAN